MQTKYDLIVIGGGASGAGIALDASLRGLKTLLLEKNDFSQGTSSRSTKLIHGGVRYLEAAIKSLNLSQYHLVKEGLKERGLFLKNASHLSQKITLVTPLYKWYEIPYIFIGLSIYDLIAGKKSLGKTQIVSKKEMIKQFPHVKKEGLKGGVRYFDGAFNDSRMNIALLQTAQAEGCVVKNYTQVIGFLYKDKKISGVRVQDKLRDEIYTFHGEVVVNATGVFCDMLRKLDDSSAIEFVRPSSGIHIVLDKKFLPNDEGLMIPKTEDGRVLFMLPYLGKCLAGTTDEASTIQEYPHVTEKEIDYLIRHLKLYFSVQISKQEILSCWSGLRPLVVSENITDTKELVREHVISKSATNLVSITGGKWTTYRKMAEDVVDTVTQMLNPRQFKAVQTQTFKLKGSEESKEVINEKLKPLGLDDKTQEHLIATYGSCALDVVAFMEKYGTGKIHKNYEILVAEVYYAIQYEFAKEPLDFLVRRSNLALIDTEAAKECLEDVALIFKEECSWSDTIYEEKLQKAKDILNSGV